MFDAIGPIHAVTLHGQQWPLDELGYAMRKLAVKI
jgi:hypothetical protein